MYSQFMMHGQKNIVITQLFRRLFKGLNRRMNCHEYGHDDVISNILSWLRSRTLHLNSHSMLSCWKRLWSHTDNFIILELIVTMYQYYYFIEFLLALNLSMQPQKFALSRCVQLLTSDIPHT